MEVNGSSDLVYFSNNQINRSRIWHKCVSRQIVREIPNRGILKNRHRCEDLCTLLGRSVCMNDDKGASYTTSRIIAVTNSDSGTGHMEVAFAP